MLTCRSEALAHYQSATKQLEGKKERLEKTKGSTAKVEKEMEEVRVIWI
jgi:hypothetical protein